MQLKGNQSRILENAWKIIQDQPPIEQYEDSEKIRGRIEVRHTEIYSTLNDGVSLDTDWRKYAKVLIKVDRKRMVLCSKTKKYKTSHDTALYLASFHASAEVFHQAIRNHWAIENRNHHVRDVTFDEDNSRIRTNPQNFSKLRSFALNILRKNHPNSFIPEQLFRNALSPHRLFRFQFLF